MIFTIQKDSERDSKNRTHRAIHRIRGTVKRTVKGTSEGHGRDSRGTKLIKTIMGKVYLRRQKKIKRTRKDSKNSWSGLITMHPMWPRWKNRSQLINTSSFGKN